MVVTIMNLEITVLLDFTGNFMTCVTYEDGNIHSS